MVNLNAIGNEAKFKIELVKYIDRNSLPAKQDKDGYIEIKSGKVRVADPISDGRYANIIADDPHIEVYINDKKAMGVVFLASSDRIELKAEKIAPVTNISVHISNDRMQAILEISKIPGKEFFVKDSKRSNTVLIRSDYNEIQPSPATLDQCLEKLKKANVDTKLINIEKINELISLESGGSAIVAEGICPINGSNSKVKFFFTNYSYKDHALDTEKKVSFIPHTNIPAVNVGDMLALRVAPVIPGKDGITVTGEVLKAVEGKDLLLKVGKGAIFLDNERKVVAVSSGRPEYKKGTISVIPILVIDKDVDADTGDVHFDGDVIIKGNIAENLKVSAAGNITVFGNIYQANVHAKGNIRVHGKIIKSKVTAGLSMINYSGVIPKLKQILEVLKECLSGSNLSEMSKDCININSKLLQIVYSKKIILDMLINDIQDLLKLSCDEETSKLIRILEDVKKVLNEINVKCIEDSGKIRRLYMEIKDYINRTEELCGREAYIIFSYAQNSYIQVNGNIVIANRGCIQTNLTAMNAILFKKPSSIARGGLLIAGKHIKMGKVGSRSGVPTYCKVLDRNGTIEASYYYSNTILNINDNVKVINSNTCGNRAK